MKLNVVPSYIRSIFTEVSRGRWYPEDIRLSSHLGPKVRIPSGLSNKAQQPHDEWPRIVNSFPFGDFISLTAVLIVNSFSPETNSDPGNVAVSSLLTFPSNSSDGLATH